jgi:hypothetical protein
MGVLGKTCHWYQEKKIKCDKSKGQVKKDIKEPDKEPIKELVLKGKEKETGT